MYKRAALVAAAAFAISVPLVLPAGAQIPVPVRGVDSVTPATTHGNSNPNMGNGMSATDMLKNQITASQRAQAISNAAQEGRKSQAVSKAAMDPGGTPDYFGTSPNYANSPLPKITWKSAGSVNGVAHLAGAPVVLPVYDPTANVLNDPANDAVVSPAESPFATDAVTGDVISDPINDIPQLDAAKVVISGGIRKFIETLPGVGAPNPSSTVQNCKNYSNSWSSATGCSTAYMPVAVPDTTTYPGSDYYVIGLMDYYQQFSPDLQPTKLRGYFQINAPGGAMKPYYLGPLINAKANVPVRVKFINKLGKGNTGDLFLPVDTTAMGAGLGPNGAPAGNYNQNRATIHLHGGLTPWISDGTPHQWTTPAGDTAAYPEGVSVSNVPDMDNGQEPQGTLTFFYTNQQSARMLWFHDHTSGMTRLNVMAGEAAGYMITDPVEQEMTLGTVAWLAANPGKASHFAAPVPAGTLPTDQVPLIVQDKTFVPDNIPSGYFPDGQLAAEDPTWDTTKWGDVGNLWFPHVYMPNQNPYDNSGATTMGRWDYGPWFWPIFNQTAGLVHGEVVNPYANAASPWEPPMIPGVPSLSLTPESYVDTPIVNGIAYPYLNVTPKAYRFRILNASNDRVWNLQLYCAKSQAPMWNADGTLNDANAGEVPMVPAAKAKGYPADWPTDGRAGGVPDPNARATSFLQIGNESGFLPNVDVVRNGPVGYNYNRRDIVVLNVAERGLMLGPAQRADVVVDFSQLPAGCKNVILYNDSPAPVPAFDPRNDYYTNDPDQTSSGGAVSTLPGYGPDTRTIMQFRVSGTAAPAFDVANLTSVLPQAFAVDQHKPIVPETAFKAAYPNDVISSSDNYSKIQSTSQTFATDIAPLTASVVTGGSGYLSSAPTATINGNGTGAAVTPVFAANGTLASLKINSAGYGYVYGPSITITAPTLGVAATARGVVTDGRLTGYTITNPGTGYFYPVVTIGAPPTGGTQATATATVTNGVVTGIVMTNSGSGYSIPPAITISGSLGTTATATTALAPVTVPELPKTIQELFELQYGRMNATLGVELPFTNAGNQTTLPMGFGEPTTEIVSPSQVGTQLGTMNNGVQIWKVTHNGVDTHFIHFHLFDVQLLNRVGWDGAVRAPFANEVGWQDTVQMNPLEDAIVALRPLVPTLPFKIPNSIRPIDPTQSTTALISSFDPTTGAAIQVANTPKDFGWEYVWHCHLLGHEENDMMRPISFQVAPPTPAIGTASSVATTNGAPQNLVTWSATNYWNMTNYVLQRATDAGFTKNVVQTTSGKTVAPTVTNFGSLIASTATSFADSAVTNGTTYFYRVRAENSVGYSVWSDPASVVARPTASAVPTNLRVTQILQTSAVVAWNQPASVAVPVSFTLIRATDPAFTTGVYTVSGIAGNLLSWVPTGMTRNKTYYFKIQSVNVGASSAWSNTLTFKTLP
jgi:FtsP/CotA-like multicopper oxidase with cupredoxin domain